jgi:hypothetical protein
MMIDCSEKLGIGVEFELEIEVEVLLPTTSSVVEPPGVE